MSTAMTNSRLKVYRACPRQHMIEYEQGYRPLTDAEALRFGSLVHLGLEAWWRAAKAGQSADERLAAALAVVQSADSDPFERARAAALLTGYALRWDDQAYEVVDVEVEFECPIVNPTTGAKSRTFTLRGKLDALVRDRDGRALLVEHKTSSEDISPGSDYWRRLRMDGQISTYYQGAAALGADLWGCVYDVLYKPQQKPLRANTRRANDETPEEYGARVAGAIAENPTRYYQRGEIVRLEQEMRDHLFDVWQTARAIRESERADRWPRNPDACFRWHRMCPYFPVCCGEASLDDPTKFRRSEIHPELSAQPTSSREERTDAAIRQDR